MIFISVLATLANWLSGKSSARYWRILNSPADPATPYRRPTLAFRLQRAKGRMRKPDGKNIGNLRVFILRFTYRKLPARAKGVAIMAHKIMAPKESNQVKPKLSSRIKEKKKVIVVVAIIITILLITPVIFNLYLNHQDEIDEISFTLKLEILPTQTTNLSISWEIENIANYTIHIPEPMDIDGTLDYSLKFPNGKVEHYTGPMIDSIPHTKPLEPGEKFQGNCSFLCSQNGSYKLCLIYHSYSFDELCTLGWKHSNVIKFTKE
jgi:hypothetical protein